jgi:hypothetical protein
MVDYKTDLNVGGFSLQDSYNHHHGVTLCVQYLFVKNRWLNQWPFYTHPLKRILTSKLNLANCCVTAGHQNSFSSHVLCKLGQTGRRSDKKHNSYSIYEIITVATLACARYVSIPHLY